MSIIKTITLGLVLVAAAATVARAEGHPPRIASWQFGAEAPLVDAPLMSSRAWRLTLMPQTASITLPPREVLAAAATATGAASNEQRPTAVTYSDGYALRARIHKLASFATLPLFGAQYLLGSKLDDGSGGEPVRATHAAIATTMVGLFGVNTVTGVWNLWEGRHDPTKRGRRMAHGLLMLAADGGFMATGLLAPTNDGGGNRSLHKNVAITSMGIATAGYLIMLFGN